MSPLRFVTKLCWLLATATLTRAEPVPLSVPAGAPPAWRVDAIRLPHAVAETVYSAKIAAYASAPSARRFAKADGPAWLQVSAQGILTGTPGAGDVGISTFKVRLFGESQEAVGDVPLSIEVCAAGREGPARFAIMSYNTWHAWSEINDAFQKGAAAILQSGADFVGLQESTTDSAQRMAGELGWYRAASGSGTAQILSRYPIVEAYAVTGLEAGRAIGARIRLTRSPVRDIVFFNCHLDYLHYGPYAAQAAGATPAAVLAEEARSQRAVQITAVLRGMSARLAQADAIPVFLTGDFNAPSHLDWTAATAAAHGGVGPVAWPTSTQVAAAGMLDSFRVVHPDPVQTPGNSWSTVQKGTEPQDRIDFVYYKGKSLRVLSSRLFTTAVEATIGAWGADTAPVRDNTWPSDHAAVLTVCEVPVDTPPSLQN